MLDGPLKESFAAVDTKKLQEGLSGKPYNGLVQYHSP